MTAVWKVCWVDQHEVTVETSSDDLMAQRSEVWKHLKTLGVHRDQIVAFYQHSVTGDD